MVPVFLRLRVLGVPMTLRLTITLKDLGTEVSLARIRIKLKTIDYGFGMVIRGMEQS